MRIEVSAVKGALDQVKRKIPSASAKGIAVASTFIQNAIKDRTRKGKSVKGGGFKPYSTKPYFFNIGSERNPKYKTFQGGYKAFRAYKGRTTTPNLFFSGQMLGNMTFKKLSSTKGQVFFPNRTQNIKAFFNDQTRPFFSVNRKEEDKAVDIFRKTFERELRI